MQIFSFAVGILHVWAEIIVVYLFYMDSGKSGVYFTGSDVFLLVGLGGLVHSMADFAIAFVILRFLTATQTFGQLFVTYRIPSDTQTAGSRQHRISAANPRAEGR
jgi:hypothetical protein